MAESFNIPEPVHENGYRPARLGKWQPKEWRPEYEKIVAFSSMGYGNRQIVELMAAHHNIKYTPQHISNILNTPQADELREIILSKLRTKTIETVEDSVVRIRDLALQRVKEVLMKKELIDDSPFAMLDRSLAVLKGVGTFKGDSPFNANINVNSNNQTSNVIVPAHQMQSLVEGLTKANEVAVIHNEVTSADRR